ncbi:MAG: discoidin domain-containing protein [Clostridia bacterium]|nr:discoidin domain-containing protein [Clostridia bacterium]
MGSSDGETWTKLYTASGKGSNTADNLFDGDPATQWSPYAPIGSQTILMDLREQKTIYGIEITLGKNAEVPKYRIEASLDGEDWVILADATLRDALTVAETAKLLADPETASAADVVEAEEALRTAYNGLVKSDPNLQGPEGGSDDEIGGDAEEGEQILSPIYGVIEPQKESSRIPFVIAGAVILVLGAAGAGIWLFKKKAGDKSRGATDS